jgi:hypothetical protein
MSRAPIHIDKPKYRHSTLPIVFIEFLDPYAFSFEKLNNCMLLFSGACGKQSSYVDVASDE